jgi:hypothetical protein
MDERRFSVVKVRSLPASFPNWQIKQELDLQDIRGWSHFLRVTHLDELPQVLNIIAGTMSIVGPRPMIDSVLAELDDADRALRAKVKPGLTGAWQTSTAGALPLSEHPELDNHYVASATLSADIHIMWLTVRSVLLGHSPEPADLVDRLSWTDSPVSRSSAAWLGEPRDVRAHCCQDRHGPEQHVHGEHLEVGHPDAGYGEGHHERQQTFVQTSQFDRLLRACLVRRDDAATERDDHECNHQPEADEPKVGQD